jgi:hypothetical protein
LPVFSPDRRRDAMARWEVPAAQRASVTKPCRPRRRGGCDVLLLRNRKEDDMRRRVLAFVLAVTVASGTQGTLMYAAAATPAGQVTEQDVDAIGGGEPAATLSGADALGTTPAGAVLCQRGANPCFGYGSWNCCTEAVILGLIGASLGNWIAVSVNVYHYWYYC